MTRIVTGVALLALALAHPLVHAALAEDAPFVDIHFGDLDLTRVEGAAALYHRLMLAAQTVCASPESREPAHRMRYQECIRRVIRDAVVRVDRPGAHVGHER
jgi:UrcA family protein